MKAKILSLGAMYFEITSTKFPIEDTLKIETETVGSDYVVDPGGSAVYFARTCAALGLKPIFIGKMGNDILGKELEKMMIKSGIMPAFIKADGVQTNVAINYVRPDGKTLAFVSGSANKSLSPNEAESTIDENLSKVNYLYLGGVFKLKSLLQIYPNFLEDAHLKGVKVAIDHGRVTNSVTKDEIEIVKNLVRNADYYFPSRDELLAVWGGKYVEAAIKNARSKNKVIIAVKDSDNGSYSIENGKVLHVPAFKVTPINTVGAGDSFNAGFIRALEEGLSLEDCLRFANATAALKISRKDLPSVGDVKSFLNA